MSIHLHIYEISMLIVYILLVGNHMANVFQIYLQHVGIISAIQMKIVPHVQQTVVFLKLQRPLQITHAQMIIINISFL